LDCRAYNQTACAFVVVQQRTVSRSIPSPSRGDRGDHPAWRLPELGVAGAERVTQAQRLLTQDVLACLHCPRRPLHVQSFDNAQQAHRTGADAGPPITTLPI